MVVKYSLFMILLIYNQTNVIIFINMQSHNITFNNVALEKSHHLAIKTNTHF